MNQISLVERIESLKAGSVGAVAAVGSLGIATLIHRALAVSDAVPSDVFATLLGGNDLVSGAIALLAGFLFGVTYRYIVRTDPNTHLKSGAVLAFGLVRGLAQVDIGLNLNANPWALIVLTGESVMLFAIACLILEWAFWQKWVKPFG